MSKRRAITPKMKVDTLLAQVWRQFGAYLVCPISKIAMEPGDPVQFDHIHCVALDGPHEYQNLRAVLKTPHRKKTKADLRMIKKTRPGHTETFVVNKIGLAGRPLEGPNDQADLASEPGNRETAGNKRKWPKGRKLPSRPFPKRKVA